MMSTSYGVRFFDRAYPRSTFAQFCAERVELVARELRGRRLREELVGRREEEALDRPRLLAGSNPADAAAASLRGTRARASLAATCRLRCAILATAATRSAISLRVKPSGKTMWNGFGIAITVSTGPVAVVRVTVR